MFKGSTKSVGKTWILNVVITQLQEKAGYEAAAQFCLQHSVSSLGSDL